MDSSSVFSQWHIRALLMHICATSHEENIQAKLSVRARGNTMLEGGWTHIERLRVD